MDALWDTLPIWLKWLILVSGWLTATAQRLWHRLPPNLYVFGLHMKREAKVEVSGSVRTSTRYLMGWGREADRAADESRNRRSKVE